MWGDAMTPVAGVKRPFALFKKLGLEHKVYRGTALWAFPAKWFDGSSLELATPHKPVLTALIDHLERAGWRYNGIHDALTLSDVGQLNILPTGLQFIPIRQSQDKTSRKVRTSR